MDTEEALYNETATWYANYDNLKCYVLLLKRLPSKNAVESFEKALGVWFNERREEAKMYTSGNENIEVRTLLSIVFDSLIQLFRVVKSYDERFAILDDIIKRNRALPLCSVSFIKTIRILGLWTMTLPSNN